MLNLYDDSFESEQYACCSCEQKDFLLREVGKALESVLQIKRTQSQLENKLMDSLENACHMAGVPFIWG